jgi:outer membrane protein TolC
MRSGIKIFIVLNIICAIASAQTDSISLFQCFDATRNNAAIKSQLETMSDISKLKTANASATNLPSLSAYGKAWYQSESMSIAMPGIGAIEIDPFQYNFGLEADQKLFDGGMAKKSKELEMANLVSETGRIETELYQLNNQTAQYFFGILLFTRNKEVIQLKEEILNRRVKELQSAFDNGVIPRNELDKIKTEVMVTRQQIMEIEKLRLQSISSLNVLTGLEITFDTKLYIPDSVTNIRITTRPEYLYFDAETKRLQSMIDLKSRQNLPKLYAYGQLGYSYPGLNFFENKSDYYYMVGARLSWNIFDWNQVSRDKRVIEKQQEIVVSKRTDFDQKLNLSVDREKIEQEKLRDLIAMDEAIIVERNSISAGSESALQNGVITSATYLEDLNNEIRARIELETHKIQLMNSVVRLYLLRGIDTNYTQPE